MLSPKDLTLGRHATKTVTLTLSFIFFQSLETNLDDSTFMIGEEPLSQISYASPEVCFKNGESKATLNLHGTGMSLPQV